MPSSSQPSSPQPTSKYDTHVDLSRANNSHTLMVQLIGWNQDVLDVGCANGYLGKVLKEHGCNVVGIEIDPAAAEEASGILDEVVVGSVEDVDLVEQFGAGRFDVVVFGDVLEHLRDPLPTLRQAKRLLKPNGYVVVSIPNIAHGSVRLALLRGEFRYRDLGLLDTTHLRFFTRESVDDLLAEAGLAAVEFLRTTAGLFETELGIKPGDFRPEVIRAVEADPEARTYQFVVKAVVDDGDRSVRELHDTVEFQREEIARLREELGRLGTEGVSATAAPPATGQAVPAPPVAARVGVVGTFDLDDLRSGLVLRVVRAELERRLPSAHVRAFAPYGYLRPNRHDGGDVIEPLRAATAERAAELAAQLDCLVVSGDVRGRHELAVRYGDPADESPSAIVALGLGQAAEESCPVIWAGVTVSPDATDDEIATLARLLGRRRWPGSVVDDELLVRLQRAGTGPVEVVPDPIFLTPRVFPASALSRRVEYLQALRWLPGSESAVIVQGGPELVPFAGDVARGLGQLVAARPQTALVLGELGDGDTDFADAVEDALDLPALRLPLDATAEDVVAAIAASDGFVGSSPVGLALALAYDRPHVGLDLAGTGALASFARTTGNKRAFVTEAAAIAPTFFTAPPPAHLLAVAAGIQGRLDAHFDELGRHIDLAARTRRGEDVRIPEPSDYVRALQAAHRALQQRILTERALLAHQAVIESGFESAPLHQVWQLQKELAAAQDELDAARRELEALRNTRMFRTLEPARRVYGRVRGLPQ
jgi:2-polyprenyl-3-methyl-5-hydroxy-6-metoxy-1,4-benzoquinol methylase